MPTLRTDLISHSQLTDGNASVLFDGTTDSITIPSTSAFAFGTGDWTVEMFVNFTSLSGQQTLVGDTYGDTAGWYLYKQSNNKLGVYYSSSPTVSGNTLIETDRWYHLAFVRHNGITSIFIDGVMDATGADTNNTTVTQYYIGDTADQSSGELFGYMSNLRITRTAVYKNNFTVPTFKLKEIPGTILLALQSSSSTTEAAVVIGGSLSANGDPTATSFGPGLKEDIKEEGVVFEGVTNFDTQDYLIPSRGKTTERNRGRAIFAGGNASPYKDIQVIDISSGGIAQDFGDTANTASLSGSASSSTRMLITNGYIAPASTNTIEFITIANIASSTDFGDLTVARRRTQSLSNSTRGVHVAGSDNTPTPYLNVIDFNTIATAGNSQDFGDTSAIVSHGGSVASSTRGVYSLSYANSNVVNTLEFITIATTGNGQDFGDLNYSFTYHFRGSTCDTTRGLFAGGYQPAKNNIDFITIASTGNGTDFGDLTVARRSGAGTANSIHSIFAGGYLPGVSNVIDRVLIQTTGNAADFGDLFLKTHEMSGSSDSHGGL